MNRPSTLDQAPEPIECTGPVDLTAALVRRLTQYLPQILEHSLPAVIERTVLAVAALHEVDERGRCRVCAECRPRGWRWWRRRAGYPCPTRRVMWAELQADGGPRFTPA